MLIRKTLIVLLFLFSIITAQTRSTITITAGANDLTLSEAGKALSAILQEANNIAEGKGDIENVREYFTRNGFDMFKELLEKTGFFSTITEHKTNLIQTPDGMYQVRGVRVRVKMGDTRGDDIQELVFVLNFRLFVDNIQFAMERHHYTRLLEDGNTLNDMTQRLKILNFLETFRTAHNRKDINFLEKAYSDDALIIVGRVLEEQEEGSDFLASSSLSQNKIEFIKLSKKQYIERLRQAFKLNSFVKVIFDNVEVIRHGKFPEIYGIKLKQRWNSSNYSDEGYLFIMIDFFDPEKPLIHVRAWQPQPFEDGSLVGLGDFEIIE